MFRRRTCACIAFVVILLTAMLIYYEATRSRLPSPAPEELHPAFLAPPSSAASRLAPTHAENQDSILESKNPSTASLGAAPPDAYSLEELERLLKSLNERPIPEEEARAPYASLVYSLQQLHSTIDTAQLQETLGESRASYFYNAAFYGQQGTGIGTAWIHFLEEIGVSFPNPASQVQFLAFIEAEAAHADSIAQEVEDRLGIGGMLIRGIRPQPEILSLAYSTRREQYRAEFPSWMAELQSVLGHERALALSKLLCSLGVPLD